MGFQPLLAATLKKETDWDLINWNQAVGSPKLDGIRAYIKHGEVLSRKLKTLPNRYVQEVLSSSSALENLDGEIVVLNAYGSYAYPEVYNSTSSGIMSAGGTPKFKYLVFDKYDDGRGLPWQKRELEAREAIDKSNLSGYVEFLPHIDIFSRQHATEVFVDYMAAGFEGLMLRDSMGLYKTGRSTMREGYLIKLKEFADLDCTIIGFKERYTNLNEATIDERGYTKRSSHKENKMPMNTLGALICTADGYELEFDVGTGFDDALRKLIWENRADWLGATIEIKHQPSGAKDRPRFPVFLRRKDA